MERSLCASIVSFIKLVTPHLSTRRPQCVSLPDTPVPHLLPCYLAVPRLLIFACLNACLNSKFLCLKAAISVIFFLDFAFWGTSETFGSSSQQIITDPRDDLNYKPCLGHKMSIHLNISWSCFGVEPAEHFSPQINKKKGNFYWKTVTNSLTGARIYDWAVLSSL